MINTSNTKQIHIDHTQSAFKTLGKDEFTKITNAFLGEERYCINYNITEDKKDINTAIKEMFDNERNDIHKKLTKMLQDKKILCYENKIYTKEGVAFFLLYLQNRNVYQYKHARNFFIWVLESKVPNYFLLWFGFRYYVNLASKTKAIQNFKDAILQSCLIDIGLDAKNFSLSNEKSLQSFINIFAYLNFTIKKDYLVESLKNKDFTYLQTIQYNDYGIVTEYIVTKLSSQSSKDKRFIYPQAINNYIDTNNLKTFEEIINPVLKSVKIIPKEQQFILSFIFTPFDYTSFGGIIDKTDNIATLAKEIQKIQDKYKNKLKWISKKETPFNILTKEELKEVITRYTKQYENINQLLMSADKNISLFIFILQNFKNSLKFYQPFFNNKKEKDKPIYIPYTFISLPNNTIDCEQLFSSCKLFLYIKDKDEFLPIATNKLLPIDTNKLSVIDKSSSITYEFKDIKSTQNIENILHIQTHDNHTLKLYNFIKITDCINQYDEQNNIVTFSANTSLFNIQLQIELIKKHIIERSSHSNFTLKLAQLQIAPYDYRNPKTHNKTMQNKIFNTIYLHNCENRKVYQSTLLKKVKDEDSNGFGTYEVEFNIELIDDKNCNLNQRTTKLIIATQNLSTKQQIIKGKNNSLAIKDFSTADFHHTGNVAIISLTCKEKNEYIKSKQPFIFTKRVSMQEFRDSLYKDKSNIIARMSSNPLAVFFESHTNTSNTKLDAKNPLIL
ncbi:hypothetical protein CQA53_10510, partial [Helicobacter didelphidarum]